MNSSWGLLWSALGIGAGLLVGLQAPINAALARGLGSALAAAAVSFTAGTLALYVVFLATGGAAALAPGWRDTPLSYFILGGLFGACYITIAAALTPKLGAGAFLAFVIAGQLTAGLAIDQFGLFGLDLREITLGRAAGAVLLFAGALMVRFL